MQTRPEGLGRQTVLRAPSKVIHVGEGLLLALDGHCLGRPALASMIELCRQNGNRLDILVLNPPEPATLMLGTLLRQLKQWNIDYRLSSSAGDLADQIALYLYRFKSITSVVLGCLDPLDASLHTRLNALRQEGYTVMALVDRDKIMRGNGKNAA
jgi:hypothetical protein